MTAPLAPFKWTPDQRAAIKALEALAQAHRAGIAICGMDDTLLAYKARSLDALVRAGRQHDRGLYDAQNELCNVRQEYEALDHHGAYRDSGGW